MRIKIYVVKHDILSHKSIFQLLGVHRTKCRCQCCWYRRNVLFCVLYSALWQILSSTENVHTGFGKGQMSKRWAFSSQIIQYQDATSWTTRFRDLSVMATVHHTIRKGASPVSGVKSLYTRWSWWSKSEASSFLINCNFICVQAGLNYPPFFLKN